MYSVCLLNFKKYKSKNVFDAYYYHHNIALFEKAYHESDQKDRLYTWVLNGWILDDVYQNEQASIFLMKEAISTSDATLIQYVYDRVSLKRVKTGNFRYDVFKTQRKSCESMYDFGK